MVLIRLGFWQLDRLEQRRNFNARASEQIHQPPLELSADIADQELASMEYRNIIGTGEYDFNNQFVLRNQSWQDQYGVHLITPLRISDTDYFVLVDRGWIPAADMDPENWYKYDEPGEIQIRGAIRRSQNKPDFGRISDPGLDPGQRLTAWNFINIDRIQRQMPFQLFPIYIQLTPDDQHFNPPYPSELLLDLTEGPHLGYAIQWFTYASILAIIYFKYIQREEKRMSTDRQKESRPQYSQHESKPLNFDDSSATILKKARKNAPK
jgi:surfeit locus 1 family protein